MKKIILILLSISFISINLFAQSENTQVENVQPENKMKYRRSSLYPILVTHPSERYSFEILEEYNTMELPDKFDDHTLSIRSISTDAKKISPKDIQTFLDDNAVGRRMVARWYNRDKITGFFNTDLVIERGNYDASVIDVDIAKKTVRGTLGLGDRGEGLIENTFVLVHDITYVDKEEGAKKAAGIMRFIGAAASVVADVTGNESVSSIADLTESVAILGASISDLISGFTVKTTSHLYQLEWTDDITNIFYRDYWCDESTDAEVVLSRKEKFENEKKLFNLTYVGSYDARSQETVLRGVHNNADIIKKVCTRTLDKNIAMLQRRYDAFKVNTPILAVDGKNIIVPIGMKEEIDVNSKFEVLEELSPDENGVTKYKRVGVVKPVKDMIWDNRYMAVEEEAVGATLKGTTFHAVSGNKFYPGLLIKEIK